MSSKLSLGINPGLSNAEYHADKYYLSSSKLKLLLESAEDFHAEMTSPSPAATGDHLDLGSFVHSLLLEPHLVDSEYAIYPGLVRRGQQFEAFKAANKGKAIITASTQFTGQQCANSVKALPLATSMLQGGEAEQSICTIINGVPVKARFDYINVAAGYILDVKTSREDAGLDEFKQTIKQYSYDLSAALYAAVAQQHYGKQFDFWWLVIAKTQPPESRLYKASTKRMTDGMSQVQQALEKYKLCSSTGIWLDPEPLEAEQKPELEYEEI